MPSAVEPSLTVDEIDDLLYFTRVNDIQDLAQTISELAQKHNCKQKAVILAGVDPASNNTLLHYCSANGFDDLLQSLLSLLGVQFEANGTVEKEQEADPIINHANEQGNTALHWAAYNGRLEAVKTLVAVGADMWIKNSAGQFAMYEAERAQKTEVVQYLIAQHLQNPSGKEVEIMTQILPTVNDIAGLEDEETKTLNGPGQANAGQANGGADVSMDSVGSGS